MLCCSYRTETESAVQMKKKRTVEKELSSKKNPRKLIASSDTVQELGANVEPNNKIGQATTTSTFGTESFKLNENDKNSSSTNNSQGILENSENDAPDNKNSTNTSEVSKEQGTETIDEENVTRPSMETSTEAPTTLSHTSQPIIIIGNYSRTSYAYTTEKSPVSRVEAASPSTTPTLQATTSTDSVPHRRHTQAGSGTPGHHFTITYWFFYPYNHGKEVCTTTVWLLGRVAKPLYKGKCMGQNIVMGNHVGDWEHLSIYFEVLFAIFIQQSLVIKAEAK